MNDLTLSDRPACAPSAGCIRRPRRAACTWRRCCKNRSCSRPRHRKRRTGTCVVRTASASRSCASARCRGRREHRHGAHDECFRTVPRSNSTTRPTRRPRELCADAQKELVSSFESSPPSFADDDATRSSLPHGTRARVQRAFLLRPAPHPQNTKRISALVAAAFNRSRASSTRVPLRAPAQQNAQS